ncbi:uncharacterized protein LOC135392307 [Ornithodoros turicata]|uniref:uncharacterized protein LOC135392307 n=1 Tax=Ornithodoros turicata TaxID=34597 RepID=UPI003138971C
MATSQATMSDAELAQHRKRQRLISALMCLRARRLSAEMQFELDIEVETSISSEIEQRLNSNEFIVAAIMASSLSKVNRRRWVFERNERWFEDTLPQLGEFHFKQTFRVSPTTFRYLVESLPTLERENTEMRDAITPEKRVAVGLYRLCSTAEDRTIGHLFGIGRSTVNTIFKELCDAVIMHLEGQWLCMVRPHEMPQHMREFYAASGFPHAVGALDGCHFPVSPPKQHAAVYYNYKGWYSIILLALVDHLYRFRYINLGSPGRCHDAHVYGRSRLCALVDGEYFRSPVTTIEETPVAPVILCDQAFPLTTNLLKPFPNPPKETPQAMFNYNLSRTTRVVENAFGRLKARFRFVMKRMECRLPTAKRAIRAACILHNVCEALKDNVEHEWEREARMVDAKYGQPSHSTSVSTDRGHEVRNALMNYFWRRSPHVP